VLRDSHCQLVMQCWGCIAVRQVQWQRHNEFVQVNVREIVSRRQDVVRTGFTVVLPHRARQQGKSDDWEGAVCNRPHWSVFLTLPLSTLRYIATDHALALVQRPFFPPNITTKRTQNTTVCHGTSGCSCSGICGKQLEVLVSSSLDFS
jgi:hypothetical protein